MHYLAEHIGKPEVTALVGEGEVLVVQSEAVQQRGVEVVDVHLVLLGEVSEIVGRPVDDARSNPPACQPHREAVRMMIAS